jgi:hypothetical protein
MSKKNTVPKLKTTTPDVIERRIAELHIIAARERALRLFAFASTTYPKEWDIQFIELAVIDLLEFGYHARRVNQLCGIDCTHFPLASRLLFEISENDPGDWEHSYYTALNRILHIKTFVFGSVHSDHRKPFLASEANLILSYVKISTDQRETATISLFGLADCFLTSVTSEIRRKYPDFQF